MRATASISPVRMGKQRLLGSCAIAAGLAALAIGGPALAQGVVGTGQVVTGTGLGPATIAPTVPGTTTVTATGAQTVINWTPTDTAPTGAAIDFLPVGNNLNFVGTGQYTVLNRFVAVNPVTGQNIPISRQVALNGNVNSVSRNAAGADAQGGNIWFYNAGGILIGSQSVINVGSLVLTANDIDTTGGLFGAGGTIRFRGPASTSAIEVRQGSSISAANPGNPGSSYVALVAPRIVQSGGISVDGSAALVAAEQADIRINNGLFDINVLVGADGGNVITHTGTTTGPAHQQNDVNQNRVYLVAIPKNDAVTMLVSGRIGYQDAMTAQTDPDGGIVLSAGYNVVGGVIANTPVNTAAANITVNDTIFESSVTAHASGAFVGQPVATIPPIIIGPSVPPLTPAGRILVRGDASFSGDASATLTVGTGQSVGATGNLTLVSNGIGAQPGSAAANVSGGTLVALGDINVTAGGQQQADGSAQGGNASLIVNGGQAGAGGAIAVTSFGGGGIGASGAGGDGTGGNATIRISGTGSAVLADTVTVQSVGIGGGIILDVSGIPTAVDTGGDGIGGDATLIVETGGSLTANDLLTVASVGQGQTGAVQSGNGTGGTARLALTGAGSTINTPVTNITANGLGGGDITLRQFPDILTQNGGIGIGGTAELFFSGDASTVSNLGDTGVSADGVGGSARGPNPNGGDGRGGDATVTATGGISAAPSALTVTAVGTGGGSSAGVGEVETSGNAIGGAITLTADNGSSLAVGGNIFLDAGAESATSSNVGSSTGGDIVVQATGGGTISAQNEFAAVASAGGLSSAIGTSTGGSTGGDIDFTADGGTISAEYFSIQADAGTRNVDQTSGAARGGTVDLLASNNGLITATNPDQFSYVSADAATGFSDGGVNATGGTVQLIANGGQLNFAGSVSLSAGGVSGGDIGFGAGPQPTGRGGSILVQTLGTLSGVSAITFDNLFASSTGSAGASVEGGQQLSDLGSANGNGGDVTIDIQGGTFSGNLAAISADGFGGAVSDFAGTGQGGTATFTQSGGTATIGDLSVNADGYGGFNLSAGPAGTGIGGTATINLFFALDAGTISALASGYGGLALGGNDDPANPLTANAGGNGRGGTATINVDGSAIVTVGSLSSIASGIGATGGDFFSSNGDVGNTGDGGVGTGGDANINFIAGELNATAISIDAGGVGGDSGSLFNASSSGFPVGVGVGGTGGSAQGGNATLTQTGGTVTTNSLIVAAVGSGGDSGNLGGVAGNGNGGTAIVNLNGGTLDTQTITALASGIGGVGFSGSDNFFATAVAGDGGEGQGGSATVNLDGDAVVTVGAISSLATGTGGRGGNFSTFSNTADDTGSGGDGTGGDASINQIEGDLTVGSLTSQASGFGGDAGNLSSSSSSGDPIGVAVAGTGGNGQGGTATIEFQTAITATGDIAITSGATGGEGSDNVTGGNAGTAQGGTAQALITDVETGSLGLVLDTTARGGNGGFAFNGTGGQGGDARGGVSRIQVDGPDGSATVFSANYRTAATGGDGGNASLVSGTMPAITPAGGNGGYGTGGTVEIAANNGATVTLGGGGGVGQDGQFSGGAIGNAGPVASAGGAALDSIGNGGNGGRGADNYAQVRQPGPDGILFTDDDLFTGFVGGNGGIAGGGVGGTVHLVANGGTITSDGESVDISVSGISGDGGDGGFGFAGTGNCCSGFVDEGGNVLLETFAGENGPGTISFGDTTISANGFIAGRIDLLSAGNISFASLTAQTLGFANATNGNTDTASEGIFLGVSDGGTIQTDGDMALTATETNGNPGGSVGIYAQGTGQVMVGGDLTISAGDQIDIRHDSRDGDAPTVVTGGGASLTAVNSILGARGSLVSAGTGLFLNATGVNALIDVDSLEAADVMLLLAQNGSITINGLAGGSDDLTVNAGLNVSIANADVGDDISLIAGGNLTLGTLNTDGTGADSELDGANIFLGSTGATTVVHAEAANDFTANVGSFRTGLNSIITGGDIVVNSPGAVDLGNSTAGGFVDIDAASIAFNTIDAGNYVDLDATGTAIGAAAIAGGSILSDNFVNLTGASIAVGTVRASGSLSAIATGGTLAIDDALVIGGGIGASATGNLTGNYEADGNIFLSSDSDIIASATATRLGSSSSGAPLTANVFVDAAGNINLTDSSATGMLGVNAGGSASVTNASAGEDMLVLAGTTATVANVTAGDDLDVSAPGGVTATNASTTGTGPDNRNLSYGQFSPAAPIGFQIQFAAPDLSNIDLAASAGAVSANNVGAFDNLALTAGGLVTTTGTVRSGLVTDISGSGLTLESITAGTDIRLTSTTGGVAATGALAAGHDLTITAATNVNVSELDAGDDIGVTAPGTIAIGAAYSYGTGLDNEGTGSNIGVTAGGALTFTGLIQSADGTTLQGTSVSTQAIDAGFDVSITSTTGNISTGDASSGDTMTFNSAGAIDSGALTAFNALVLAADGAITLAGNGSSGQTMQIIGASLDATSLTSSNGNIVLVANDGAVTLSGGIESTNGQLLISASDAVDVTGDVFAATSLDISGGRLDLGNVTGDRGFVQLSANNGAVNATGTIDAGTDIIIGTAGGAQLNRLIAGDDIGITGSGDVNIAFMNATGERPGGEEVGSNIGIFVDGDVVIGHAEAADNFTASVGTFTTGLNSILTGGDIDITAVGAADLGNSTAGGFIAVNAQSIAFNALDAGTNVGLNATGTAVGASGITGGQVTAGGDATLYGSPASATLTIAAVNAGGNVEARGGTLAFGDVVAGTDALLSSFNGALSVGDVTAGDDIFLTVNGSNANSATISPDSQIGQVSATQFALTAGNLRSTGLGSDAAASGPRTFAGSGPTGNVVRVRASGAVQTGDVTTGGTAILTSDLSTITAQTISAAAGIGLFVRGNVTTGDIATTGALWVGDSSQYFLIPSAYQVSNFGFSQTATAGGATLGAVTAGLIRGTVLGDTNFTSLNSTLDTLWTTGNSTTVGGSVSGGALTAGATLTIRAGGGVSFTDATAGSNVFFSSSTGTIVGDTVVGGTVDLSAATGITVTGIESSGNATLGTASGALTFDTIVSGDNIFAGGETIVGGTATAASNIIANAFAGDLTGSYRAQGDIFLSAGGDIMASANATGFEASSSGPPTASSVFVDAVGDVALTGSSATRSFGVNAGGSVSIATANVGEDLLVLAGTTATLSNITVGDDLNVTGGGLVTVNGATATGNGSDASELFYSANGFTINQGEGIGVLDGADITLTSTGAGINATSLSAGDDIFLDAANGLVSVAGATTNGTGNTGGDSSIVSNSRTGSFTGLDSHDDVILTIAAGTAPLNDFTVGRDLIVDANALSGNLALAAGRDITITTVADLGVGGLDAGRDLTLTSDGAISTGDASADGNVIFDAGGTIVTGALTSGFFTRLTADGDITVTGDITANQFFSAFGASVDLTDANFVGGQFAVNARSGDVTGTGSIDANGSVTAIAADNLALTGPINALLGVDMQGTGIQLGDVTSQLTFISLTAGSGGVTSAGTFTADGDISINTGGGANLNRLIAGDDIGISGSGDVDVAFMDATGDSPDGEEVGSNIGIFIDGDVVVGHAEAADNFFADVGSFSTGLNSIITGGDIDITAVGPADLGNSTAGGHIDVDAQSIAFNTLDAGDYVDLNATGTAPGAAGIAGGAILADNYVNLLGNSITVATIDAAGSLSANATGGDVAIDQAVVGGAIFASAAGDLTGGYEAQGNIFLRANGDIMASADATGSQSSSSGGPTTANVFVDAAGDVTLTDSSATGSFGVNAGGSASIATADVGQDLLVLAGTTATLSNITVGDDLNATGGGLVTVNGATATGNGSDASEILYSANGFTINQGEGNAVFDGADIDLRSTGGSVAATNLSAGDDIFLNAANGLVSVTGATTNGIGNTGGDSSIISNSQTGSFTGLNSHDDVRLTIAAGTTPLSDFTVGRDLIVDANAISGDMSLAAGRDITITAVADLGLGDLDAGRNLTLTSDGDITAGETSAGSNVFLTGNSITVASVIADGSLLATATGGPIAIEQAVLGDYIDASAAGNLTGNYQAQGDIFLTSGADILASAAAIGFANSSSGTPTASNVFVDADGNVELANSSATGLFGVNAGGSVLVTTATVGEDMLVIAGTSATLSGITVGDDFEVRAADAISVDGASATGTGPDRFRLDYNGNGFTFSQGEGVSTADGSDIFLSAGGAINAAGLSAGDDIFLEAGTTLAVNGATTLGLGDTGGDSSIRTQSGDASLAGLDAFDDVDILSSGAVDVTGRVRAGRDIAINAVSASLASLTDESGAADDTVIAGRNLDIMTSGAITGGSASAGNNLTLTAGTTIDIGRAATGAGGNLVLDANDGIFASLVQSGGTTGLTSDEGAIDIRGLESAGPVAANGDSIMILGGNTSLVFSALNADVGDASVVTNGNLAVTDGQVAGLATLRSNNGDLGVTQLGADDIDLRADDGITLGTVTAGNSLLADAGGVLTVNNGVTGLDISVGSADIVIGANGRLGTGGSTQTLDIRNTDGNSQTFVGGTGSREGYHIDAAEMSRLFGNDITIFAPRVGDNDGGFNNGGLVAAAPGGLPIASVGSSDQPDVIIDDFTIMAGASTSNLGTTGTLTIETPGKARVIGDVLIGGVGDNNGFTIHANDALEVILGEGTIRMVGGGGTSGASTPGGVLTLESDDVIVATAQAIGDVGAATDIAAIDERLAMNDGVTSDEGALFAGGIEVSVVGGFYIQNSGTGTSFAERRGLTFGPLGLNVNVEGSDSRIVINGVHLGPSGQVTGLDAIPLLSINGFVIGSGPLTGSGLAFDSGSTMNGCLIVSSTSCAFQEFESSFPVQDVIENEDDVVGDATDGIGLPTALITLRDLDPLTGQPLLDDPVTGAGNDDLWTPPSDDLECAVSGGSDTTACPAAE